jgi:hypothetical protein
MAKYEVVLDNGRREDIDADKFTVDGGYVLFSRFIGDDSTDVILDAIYAPTYWRAVKKKESK